jgi:periplasmic nitrate reductase NapE
MASNKLVSMEGEATKGEERRVFFFLVVCLAPILAVMVVGGYGFLIWMLQIVFGPPSA